MSSRETGSTTPTTTNIVWLNDNPVFTFNTKPFLLLFELHYQNDTEDGAFVRHGNIEVVQTLDNRQFPMQLYFESWFNEGMRRAIWCPPNSGGSLYLRIKPEPSLLNKTFFWAIEI